MANRSAEIISKEINEKMMKRTELLTNAKEIVMKELAKYDTLTFTTKEQERTVTIEGSLYGKAVLDLNHWFGQVRELDPPENLARDMMEDIKNQLLPERDYSM